MKKMKFLILALSALLIVFTSCKTNYNVVRVDLNKKPDAKSGFYYSLPKNALVVTISVDKEDHLKGPYCDYAKQYFGLNNVITQNSSTYQIRNITVETISEIDTSNIYFVETNDASLKINFSQPNIISDINCTESPENITQKQTIQIEKNKDDNADYPVVFRKFADLNIYEKVDTIYKRIKIDTSFIVEKTFKTSLVEKPTDLKVKEVVDYITKIKDTKFSIISGDLDAVDKKNLEFMYKELQNQEEQYMNLFTGITVNNTMTYSFVYHPQTDTDSSVKNEVLFRFSASRGIVTDEGFDTDDVSIQINNSKFPANLEQHIAKKSNLQKSKHGFYYRIPALVDIDILMKNQRIFSCKKEIAQMGMIFSLPRKNLSLIFNDNIGSIKLLKIN